jgi:hypothetical protein
MAMSNENRSKESCNMKKTLIGIALIGMIVFSGFTSTISYKNTFSGKAILQEETTETTEVTETATTVVSTTVAPTATTIPTATAVPTATTPAYSRPLLNLTSYSYDSSEVYAGNVFGMDCVFQNLGQQRAYNVVVTYSASSLTAEDNGGVDVISSLGASESATSEQDFTVSSSISSSPVTVNVNIEYRDESGKSYTQSFAVSITVTGYGYYYTSTPEGRPQIVVANYETDIDPLEPGTSFVLSMNLQNRGYMTAQNVSMVFGGSSSSGSSTTTTTTSADDNFLPLGSSNVQVIGDVGVNQYIQVQQTLVVNSEITPGVYPLTLSFTYTDEDGNEFTDNQIITLLVHLVPSIEVSFYETPDPFYVGEASTLPIQVVNIGSDSVLLGDIYINAENVTLSNNLTFVGTLESGGSFTIDTDITPQQAGTFPVTVTINYQDNFKKAQTITQTLNITVTDNQMAVATIDPALVATEMAKMPNGGFPTSNSNENFGSILLRFFRGMIGFDSSAVSGQNRNNPGVMNTDSSAQ